MFAGTISRRTAYWVSRITQRSKIESPPGDESVRLSERPLKVAMGCRNWKLIRIHGYCCRLAEPFYSWLGK
jgi:hypothetical protein